MDCVCIENSMNKFKSDSCKLYKISFAVPQQLFIYGNDLFDISGLINVYIMETKIFR